MNPLDEALQAKEAFLGGLARGVGNYFKSEGGRDVLRGAREGAGGLAVAGLATLALTGVKKLHDAASTRQDFRAMLDADSGLLERHDEDPQRFNATYSSLRRINPTYAADPLVAASYMHKMMDASPGGAGTILAGSVREPNAPDYRSRMGVSVSSSAGPIRFERQF